MCLISLLGRVGGVEGEGGGARDSLGTEEEGMEEWWVEVKEICAERWNFIQLL